MENPSRRRRALRPRQRRLRSARHRPRRHRRGLLLLRLLLPRRLGPHRRLRLQPRRGLHRRRLRPQLRHRNPFHLRRRLRSALLRQRHSPRTLRLQRPPHRVPCHRHPRQPRPRLLRRSRRWRPTPRRPHSLKHSRRCSLKSSVSRRPRHLLVHRLPAARVRGNTCAMDRRGTPPRMPHLLQRRMPHPPRRLTCLRADRRQLRTPLPRGPVPAVKPRCRPERRQAPHRSYVMPRQRSLRRFRQCPRRPRP
jgi:hypothetical protein